MPLAALVSNLGQKAMREYPLERQRPVFEVSVMALRIPRLGRAKWGSQLGRCKRPRQAWHIRRRNINPFAGALVPVAEVVHLVRLIVHPEPGAEDRLSSGSPGHPRQAQPWREVFRRWRTTLIPILMVCRPLTMLKSSYASIVVPISSSREF